MLTVETDLTGSLVATRKAILAIDDEALVNGWHVERVSLRGGFSVDDSLRTYAATEVALIVGRRRGAYMLIDGKLGFASDPVYALGHFLTAIASWHPVGYNLTAAKVAAEMGLTYEEVMAELK